MTLVCPGCGLVVAPTDAFCEACGAELAATDPSAVAVTSAPEGPEAPVGADPLAAATVIGSAPRPTPTECAVCGGAVADDGYCTSCGAKARTWRDHWTETPSTWVGAVCDKGIRHARNEDAMATMASEAAAPGADSVAVLVVCDGVTSAPDSDQASLAAATDARDHLVAAQRSTGIAPGAAGIDAATRWMTAACRIAQVAVLRVTDRLIAASPTGALAEPPSCTFVAAVVTGRRVVVGWCGDSRAYWLADGGGSRQLGADHSLATELIAGGMSRADAERDPTAHTITRWLGADSVTPHPDVVTLDVDGPGWLLVCSDGLWNYASEPERLVELLAEAAVAGATTPTALAESLAGYANACGGHDNISVALARIAPDAPADLATSSAPPAPSPVTEEA